MALNKYYEDELSYLRDLGDEFARDNPKLVSFLSRQSSDPDVERLIESFAFLTARLREKLDDELPELAHSLVQLLWPHYLRPIPAMSLLEFKPVPGAVQTKTRIARGVPVQSRPIDGTACQFRTCYDVDLLPLTVQQLEVESSSAASLLRLRLQTTDGLPIGAIGADRLRLHLGNEREPLIARTLHLWLTRYVSAVTIVPDSGAEIPVQPAITAVGFGPDEDVIPYPVNAFAGYRLAQEYFVFPQKFMFAEIGRLNALSGVAGQAVTLRINFSRPFPDRIRLSPSHVRLNCTPVVNLFAHDGQPLTVDHAKTEYRVRPSGTNALHYSIHGIERVTGWIQGRGERVVYEAFESFRHAIAAGGDQTYYRTRLKPSVTRRGGDLYMSFVNREEQIARAATETVSLALTCSNGPLAELVPIGGIDQPTSSTPSMVTFQNIGTVTPEVPPPIGTGLMWRLIANMARNYASLADVEALRTVLSTYHFAATFDVQQARRLELLMEGLQGIETEPFEWIHRGLPIRGHKVRLSMVESKVGGEAEAHLFGAVLNQFLGIYASVNACHQLVVRGSESKVEFEWPARVGVNPGI